MAEAVAEARTIPKVGIENGVLKLSYFYGAVKAGCGRQKMSL
jgi:hypothetical protein